MSSPRSLTHLLPAAAVGAIAAVAALLAVAAAPLSRGAGGLLGVAWGASTDLLRVLVVALCAGLLIVAHGVWRGSRRAAAIAVAVLAALGAVTFGDGRVVAVASLAAGLTVAVAHRSFRVGAVGAGARVPAVAVAGCLLAGWAIATAAMPSHGIDAIPGAALAALEWLGNGSWWMRSDGAVAVGLDVLASAALVAGAWWLRRLLRPATARVGHTPAEHDRAAAIVAAHATDSLAPFALREDKSFHFAEGGVLAYRTLRGTAVVSGDPIGPPGSAARILESFDRLAASRGWDVVVTGAAGAHLEAYDRLGFKAIRIGEEAVVDPAGFSLAGRAMKELRHAVTRQARRGWSITTVAGGELDAATVVQIAEVQRRWRAAQPRLTGFAMTLGRLWGAAEDDRCVYVLARDPHGSIGAFLRFAEYRDGLSLDAMRRVGESPNGLTDAMVVAAIELARHRGLQAVSLNFAGFAHIMGPDRVLTRGQRLTRRLLERGRARFQLERLVMFNHKFMPRWEPRYLLYREPQRLPVLGLRVLQAEAYVRPPRSRVLAQRWEPLPLPDHARLLSATPAVSSATAAHVPARVSWGERCCDSGPETVAASDTAPANMSSTTARAAQPARRAAGRTPPARRATPASTPAGTHAAARRASGWSSPPCSCCSGSDPATLGPYGSSPMPRIQYSQPTPAGMARTATDQTPAVRDRRNDR
jgi:lysyl-tRNA synthetase, class II